MEGGDRRATQLLTFQPWPRAIEQDRPGLHKLEKKSTAFNLKDHKSHGEGPEAEDHSSHIVALGSWDRNAAARLPFYTHRTQTLEWCSP